MAVQGGEETDRGHRLKHRQRFDAAGFLPPEAARPVEQSGKRRARRTETVII